MTISYSELKLLVDNKIVKKPEKLSFDDFYNWSLLSSNYNFFQLFPYLQLGGCIVRYTTMSQGEYIKLSSFDYSPDILMFTKFKDGQPIGIVSLFYQDLIYDDWKIVHETMV